MTGQIVNLKNHRRWPEAVQILILAGEYGGGQVTYLDRQDGTLSMALYMNRSLTEVERASIGAVADSVKGLMVTILEPLLPAEFKLAEWRPAAPFNPTLN